jgi:hypothetical protein
MEYIATFFTHSGAIKYQKFLRAKSIAVELMPVPRKFSSNCGIGAKFIYEDDIKNIVSTDIEKLYSLSSGEGTLIYHAD